MKVIGITGGIGSGKSRILDDMEAFYHARVLKTDEVAYKLQEPGNFCYDEIVRVFGREMLDGDGRINRTNLGNLVFSDVGQLEKLNRIVHPSVKQYVREEIERARKEGVSIFLLESALLMEDHYEELCDELWYIFVERRIRFERLKESRSLSDDKIRQIMENQADEATYRAYCDVTIDNSGTFEETKRQIETTIRESDGRE